MIERDREMMGEVEKERDRIKLGIIIAKLNAKLCRSKISSTFITTDKNRRPLKL